MRCQLNAMVLIHQGKPPFAKPKHTILMKNTHKTNLKTPVSPAQAPVSFLVKRERDGSVCPQELQKAKQAFGLEHDNEVAVLQQCCGNTSIVDQSGPIAAVVTSYMVETTGSGVPKSARPQLQIVGESRGFQSLMNELIASQTMGLIDGEYSPGQWVGGLWLRGRTRSVMLCLNPLSPMTRGLIQHCQNSGKVSVLFANPLEGMRSEEYDVNGCKTLARMLALPIPQGYAPDVVHIWEGMQWMAARHKDPNTLYLTILEETALASVRTQH